MRTPMDPNSKLQKSDESEEVQEGTYRSLVGCLMYLTATRPGILFAVNTLSRFLNCAKKEHWVAAKRVLRYLRGTQTFGIRFSRCEEFGLVGYSDSDWAGCVDDMRSTSGFCFSFGSGCFSWSSKSRLS
ncbi:PREDICTED: uncharacterized protein LOC109116286 [Tarenaya hassleriana]|uniref:uncharacterized protein LOC109116286 n=1 Tax=Tarenaya hassleriana TaxID=28532 RepID=UPI0008FD5448|nr:PREDICTED: uncharacterized protein LOC109116286 [Tarenaya hassleriana]